MRDLSGLTPGDVVRLIAAPDARVQVLQLSAHTSPGGMQYEVLGRVYTLESFELNLTRFNVLEIEPLDVETSPETAIELAKEAQRIAVRDHRFDFAGDIRSAIDCELKRLRHETLSALPVVE